MYGHKERAYAKSTPSSVSEVGLIGVLTTSLFLFPPHGGCYSCEELLDCEPSAVDAKNVCIEPKKTSIFANPCDQLAVSPAKIGANACPNGDAPAFLFCNAWFQRFEPGYFEAAFKCLINDPLVSDLSKKCDNTSAVINCANALKSTQFDDLTCPLLSTTQNTCQLAQTDCLCQPNQMDCIPPSIDSCERAIFLLNQSSKQTFRNCMDLSDTSFGCGTIMNCAERQACCSNQLINEYP